jgi:hypothetical protein
MKFQTVIEQLHETSPRSWERDIERTTATPSRLTCRWEQDTRGKLACFWTLQPKEERDAAASVSGYSGPLLRPTRCALDHSPIRFVLFFATQERTSMRAYLTVAGMALGLVALWAALAPLLA